ncbi:hypothetical protein CHGG_04170 [Chaetomium globosum CBS 148.51]|uniref:Rad4 beta-hairpin domain-containing protein n=1 Tax=Chaetomium globosum (strain ATCC 6205 / CBS 148.51 / DSM 1962 / NBRC 6347 / NRRL 1970) TaxID=306901 RepID=Q2H226_CHAGB|nr:uncharacterized protein CHGG_04170 [Chaetomium globosum CBS 148.51]EAQ87551.1 hypothetical protein CHGG_04170 [Chaetomium globosum CBS 148.51]
MPPHVPRKRLRNSTPPLENEIKIKQKSGQKNIAVPPRKSTLFDDLDAGSTPQSSTRNASSNLEIEDSDDDESSLTSLSDADFEDAPSAKRRKTQAAVDEVDDDDEDDEDDEDIQFEDVETPQAAFTNVPIPTGDLELTLIRDTRISLANALGKKGPSKLERKIRFATHCAHVQFLMWHNALRNSWLCDPTVQGILLSHLPPRLWAEVDRWRNNSGLEVREEAPQSGKPHKNPKGKGKGPARKGRDWSAASERLEKGAVDMSHGDPLFRLMKYLAAWWKQRFRITAPGLRKWGYMSLERLDRLTKAFQSDEHDQERFGERVRDIDEFRLCAQECTGSRDVGAQLFTGLLRALGLEARLVANIQPLGFGWNKLEEADPEKEGFSYGHTPKKEPAQRKLDTTRADATKTVRSTAQSRGSKRQTKAQLEDPSDSELAVDDSDDDLAIHIPQAPQKRGKIYDADLEFPHYWTEVLSPVTNKYLVIDPIVKAVIATNRELVESLEPRVKRYDQFDWFRSVMNGYARGDRKHPITEVDDDEDAADLKPAKPEKKEVKEGEETLQYYKQSKDFVLARHLKREEALLPGAQPVKTFKNKGKAAEEEPVYARADVVQVKSAETWHKQGRAPKSGEQPLKRVPYRAATTNRRREIAEAEAATGEKVLQGLYGFDQTDWIIPPPIENGVIPKNEYGNIDLFAEHMCPEGALHVPFRGAMRVAKKMGIDFAEAVVDFEFGHRMAVPVIQGVVIAEEHHDQLMELLAKDEEEKKRKEDEKRRKVALGMWRRFVMGLRIVDRIRQDYGQVGEDVDVFGRGNSGQVQRDREEMDATPGSGEDEDMAGGFLPEGYEEEEERAANLTSGFFPVVDEEEDGEDDMGVLEVDHGEAAHKPVAGPAKPVPRTKPKPETAAKAKTYAPGRKSRRPNVLRREEEEGGEGDEEADSGL